ncbi:hypothetical protein AYI68_g3869, partial [Smittium mucronatum]
MHGDEHQQQEQQPSLETLQLKIQELKTDLENLQGTSNPSFKAEETPVERIYVTDGESYKYGSWDLNPESHEWIIKHDSEHKLASQSVSAIKNRHPVPSGGHFKANESIKNLKLTPQATKEDTTLMEAEQQILDLARIGLHIEELSRGFSSIETPTESQAKLFAEEINGNSQDLLRLAFSYAHKWKHSRRTATPTSTNVSTCSMMILWNRWKRQDNPEEMTAFLDRHYAINILQGSKGRITHRIKSTEEITHSDIQENADGILITIPSVTSTTKAPTRKTIESGDTTTTRSHKAHKETSSKTSGGFRVVQGRVSKPRGGRTVEIKLDRNEAGHAQNTGKVNRHPKI